LQHDSRLTDGQLVGCFVDHCDEAAFTALVKRHGGLVWGVCRRLLNLHDAEDAFQATFLVLCRKAASIRRREMVASWLYGVAYQTALQARRTAARRRAREKQVREMPEPAVVERVLGSDLQPLLDQELSRLRDNYRAVLILSDLEGKTRKEVARQLGLAEGTVASRLARARRMLARRLTHRGLTLSGGALAGILAQAAASSGAPTSVVSSMIKAASLLAAGRSAPGAISTTVAALMRGVLKTMLLTKLKSATALVVVLAVTTLTYGIVAGGSLASGKSEGPPAQDKPRQEAKAKTDRELLQGTWKLVSGAEDGKKGKAEDGDLDALITVKGETLHLQVTDRNRGTLLTDRFFVYKLDTTTSPRLIDLADWQKGFGNNSEVIEGVYSLEGDMFTICLGYGALSESRENKDRPTTLEPRQGSKTTAWTLKREKAGDEEEKHSPSARGGEQGEQKEAGRSQGAAAKSRPSEERRGVPVLKDIPFMDRLYTLNRFQTEDKKLKKNKRADQQVGDLEHLKREPASAQAENETQRLRAEEAVTLMRELRTAQKENEALRLRAEKAELEVKSLQSSLANRELELTRSQQELRRARDKK
jgi:RNA polymerase sigma factor (sigma-70 family)